MNLLDDNTKVTDVNWAKQIASILSKRQATAECEQITQEIANYENRKVSIALVGLNKRGKSTLCNVFLGRKDNILAPVDRLPATGIISKFKHSKDRENAEIIFLDKRPSKVISYEEISDYVTETKNPDNAKGVDHVDVYGKFDLDDDIELWDMPGDNSIHANHSQIVYQYLPSADVIIFMSCADDPIRVSELEILRKIKDNNDTRKLFFVMNKVDQCDEDELNDAEVQDEKVLKNACMEYHDSKIYRISAKKALEENLNNSGISELINAVKQFLRQEKTNLLRDNFIRTIKNIASPQLNVLAVTLHASTQKIESIASAIDVFQKSRVKMEEDGKREIEKFEQAWGMMLSEFEGNLNPAEQCVKTKVSDYISGIPMLGMSKKAINAIPGAITDLIEKEMSKQAAHHEKEALASIEKLNANFPSVSRYLADNDYRLKLAEQAGFSLTSSVSGIAMLGVGAVVAAPLGVATAISGWTVCGVGIGKGLAILVGTLGAPFIAVGTAVSALGLCFIAIPVFSWIRGKNKQKKELLADAIHSVEAAFREIRQYKIPELRRQAQEIVTQLEKNFQKDADALEVELKKLYDNKAQNQEKPELIEEYKACQAALSDLLQKDTAI